MIALINLFYYGTYTKIGPTE